MDTVEGLHHAQLTIPKGRDADAREFYCTFLGLREVDKPENLRARGGFWLQLGTVQVHVGAEDGVDRLATKAHLAYRVRGLSSWRQKLRERGIECLEGLPIPGMERFEFRDPFGNRVEFLELVGLSNPVSA